MKVLIVGGAGYIGSHVTLAFLKAGHSPTVLDDFSLGSRKNIPSGVEIFEGSILDRPFLKKALSMEWDGIIHLAALKAVGRSMEAPGEYATNNINGTINLLDAMESSGSPPFVFSSSAAIFGEPQKLPIDEDHPKNPSSFYGFTKNTIEELLIWYDRLKNQRSISLRYFNAAGYDPSGQIQEPEKDPQNLLPIIMETAAKLRESITIYGDDYDTPDGTCIRDYIHVSDLAEAHISALEYLRNEDKSTQINLGSQTGISVKEMLEEACRVTGIDIPYKMGARRPGPREDRIGGSYSLFGGFQHLLHL